MNLPIARTYPEITLTINDLSRGGSGVGKDADGRVIFVPLTAPGDVVRVKILSSKKKFAQGELLEILTPSPERIAPKCAVFGKCGGCEWQHVSYELQWKTKSKGVLHTLFRKETMGPNLGLIPTDEMPAEQVWSYRNRVQFHGLGDKVGFYARNSRDLVATERCEISNESINQILPEIRKKGKSTPDIYKVEADVDAAGEVRLAWNRPHAAFGFRQVHDLQNLKLQKWVQDRIQPGRVVYDLFGGSGNLSLPLASRMKAVHCVDFQTTTSSGAPPPPEFHFHASSVVPWLMKQSRVPQQDATPSTAIIDPPREGIGADLIEISSSLQKLGVTQLIAIGCDADHWARDLTRWRDRGWTLQRVGLLDLFPQTHHIECLAELVRN